MISLTLNPVRKYPAGTAATTRIFRIDQTWVLIKHFDYFSGSLSRPGRPIYLHFSHLSLILLFFLFLYLQRVYILDVLFKGKVHPRLRFQAPKCLKSFNRINVMLNAKFLEVSRKLGFLPLIW